MEWVYLVINTIINTVNSLGYLGIFTATSLEYGCFPISSEVLLPFIGYIVYIGDFSLVATILISTLGGVLGSLFCYCLGRFGKKFIEKTICNRFKSMKIGLKKAEDVFKKYGKQSVFIARLFPIARTYISIPAGLSEMNVVAFIIYTGMGAFLWNTVLISTGYLLGEYWSTAIEFITDKNILFYIIILLIAVLLIKISKDK